MLPRKLSDYIRPSSRIMMSILTCLMMAGGLGGYSASAESLAIAGALSYQGSAIQGGMISAKLPDEATAMLDSAPLPVSENGYIAFGFHRDDTARARLVITHNDGTTHLTDLTPTKRSYETQSITGLAGKYVSPPQETLERIASDRRNVADARAVLSLGDVFITDGLDWPLQGTITGIYGSQRILNGQPRAPHYGIDIAAPTGTPVIAPADGIITLADDLYYTGGTLIIDHGLHISSTLLHLQTMTVDVGDRVTAGMVIGTVGSTGRSTGPHLDWRINWNEKRLDPQLAIIKP